MVVTIYDNGPLQETALQSASQESKNFQVFSGTIKIGAGLFPNYDGDSGVINVAAAWKSSYSLVSAQLIVEAKQDFGSVNIAGAPKLVISLNDAQIGEIDWGFLDTGDKTEQIDVTNDLVNGVDKFDFHYNIPDGIILGTATCTVKATLLVIIMPPPSTGGGAPPPGGGFTGTHATIAELIAFLSSTSGIVTIVTIAALIIASVAFVEFRPRKSG